MSDNDSTSGDSTASEPLFPVEEHKQVEQLRAAEDEATAKKTWDGQMLNARLSGIVVAFLTVLLPSWILKCIGRISFYQAFVLVLQEFPGSPVNLLLMAGAIGFSVFVLLSPAHLGNVPTQPSIQPSNRVATGHPIPDDSTDAPFSLTKLETPVIEGERLVADSLSAIVPSNTSIIAVEPTPSSSNPIHTLETEATAPTADDSAVDSPSVEEQLRLAQEEIKDLEQKLGDAAGYVSKMTEGGFTTLQWGIGALAKVDISMDIEAGEEEIWHFGCVPPPKSILRRPEAADNIIIETHRLELGQDFTAACEPSGCWLIGYEVCVQGTKSTKVGSWNVTAATVDDDLEKAQVTFSAVHTDTRWLEVKLYYLKVDPEQ